DNDFNDTKRETYPVRWTPDKGWTGATERPKSFAFAGTTDAPEWLRYRHLPLRSSDKPELITDVMGYNSSESFASGGNWVGDLMLEPEVQIDKAQGELRLELSRGMDRFQARFTLQTGDCTLVRLSWDKPPTSASERAGVKETELGKKPTAMKQPGKYHVRLAN